MQSFCNFNIFMFYRGLRHIMEQRIHYETNYTHALYTQMMKLKSLTKMIKMTVMTKKAGNRGDDDDV